MIQITSIFSQKYFCLPNSLQKKHASAPKMAAKKNQTIKNMTKANHISLC